MSQLPPSPGGMRPAPQPPTAELTPVTDKAKETPAVPEAPTLAPAGAELLEPSLVGTTIGDFDLVEEIGRGGMGVVYKARQNSLDRMVALKMLLTDHNRNATLMARFLAEARTAASLAHPNIVNVFQVGESAHGPYFVMEFVDGQTLEVLIQNKTVPFPWAVGLLIPVAEAVHFAHTKGIIHRDLKPANVMIDKFRRPVVMDFGIAKAVGKGKSLTQQGMVMGTPAYMPPEQAGEEMTKLGPHSDVYSLGAILYTMLTGKAPFEAETALKTILKVISDEPPTLVRAHRPETPAALEAICMKCLNKAPADRYASAHALAEDLRKWRSAAATSKVGASGEIPALPPVILIAESSGKQVRLTQPVTVVGRVSGCNLVLKAPEVSKRHCQILIQKDQVLVEDLGSVNGTYINEQPIQKARLSDGDKLDIAGHVFEVRITRLK